MNFEMKEMVMPVVFILLFECYMFATKTNNMEYDKNENVDINTSNHEASSICFKNIYVVKIHKSNETDEFRLLKRFWNLKFKSYMILTNIKNFPYILKNNYRIVGNQRGYFYLQLDVESRFFSLLSNFIQFSFYFPIETLGFEEFFVIIAFLDALNANFDNNFINVIRNILASLSTTENNKLNQKTKSIIADISKNISYEFYDMILKEYLDIYFPNKELSDIFIDQNRYFDDIKRYEIIFEMKKNEILIITADLLNFYFLNISSLEKSIRMFSLIFFLSNFKYVIFYKVKYTIKFVDSFLSLINSKIEYIFFYYTTINDELIDLCNNNKIFLNSTNIYFIIYTIEVCSSVFSKYLYNQKFTFIQDKSYINFDIRMNTDLKKLLNLLKQTMQIGLNKKCICFKSSIFRDEFEPSECEISEIYDYSLLFDSLITEENLHSVIYFRCKNIYSYISGRICDFKKIDRLKIQLRILNIYELNFFGNFTNKIFFLKLLDSKIYFESLNDILSLELLEYLIFSDSKIIMKKDVSFMTFNYSIKHFEYHGSLFYKFFMIFEFIRVLVNVKTVILNLLEDSVPLQYEEKLIPIKPIDNLIYKNFNAKINDLSVINNFSATTKLSLHFKKKYKLLGAIFCRNNFDHIKYLEIENFSCKIYDKNILANSNLLRKIYFKKIKFQGLSFCDLFSQTIDYEIYSIELCEIFISNNDIKFLNNLKNLVHLKFYHCKFGDNLFECIDKCSFANVKLFVIQIFENTIVPDYVLYLKEILSEGILSIQ